MRRLPLTVLVLLLGVHFAVAVTSKPRALITDELYYVAKGRYLAEHGSLPRADEVTRRVEAGAWGNGDWRPQGHAFFLVLLGGLDDDNSVRLRNTVAQFLMMAALAFALFAIFCRYVPDVRAQLLAALLFGLVVWPFEYVTVVGPDTPNAFVAGVALLLLWRYVVTGSLGILTAGALLMSLTFHLRPEMIAVAPLMIGAAIMFRFSARAVLLGITMFAAALGLQVAYRVYFIGRPSLFPSFTIVNAGAFEWTRTWPGTEKEAYDFVYAITEGREYPLPDRAFSSGAERAEVERARALVRANGTYLPEADAIFARLAEQRRREHPVLFAALRVIDIAQLWVHLESPTHLLEAFAHLPRFVRLPILAGLHLVKLVTIVLGVIGGIRALRRAVRRDVPIGVLTALMFVFLAVRTLEIVFLLGWRVHRYMVVAWLPMIWCAATARSLQSDRGPLSPSYKGD